MIKSISDAKRANDLVAFSIHAHEVATSGSTASAAEFLPPLFHEAIDAGADIVLRSGPHVLGGVEIYKGKPIFYGLNSLFFIVGGAEAGTNAARRQQTGFYDSAVGVTEFKGGKPSVRADLSDHHHRRPACGVRRFEDRHRAPTPSGSSSGSRKNPSHSAREIKIENDVGIIRIAR